MAERQRDQQELAASQSRNVRLLAADGLRWVVREVAAPQFDRRGGTHLVFDGELVMRRVRVFPEDWYSLPDGDLYTLSVQIRR